MWIRIRISGDLLDPDPNYGKGIRIRNHEEKCAENAQKVPKTLRRKIKLFIFKFKMYFIKSNTVKSMKQALYFQVNFVGQLFSVMWIRIRTNPHYGRPPQSGSA